MRFYVPYATPNGPSWYELHMPVVRMVEQYSDPPFAPAPYSSVFKDVEKQNYLHKRDARIHTNALFPFRLKAGQKYPVNGQFGRNFVPLPPEVLSGNIYTTTI